MARKGRKRANAKPQLETWTTLTISAKTSFLVIIALHLIVTWLVGDYLNVSQAAALAITSTMAFALWLQYFYFRGMYWLGSYSRGGWAVAFFIGWLIVYVIATKPLWTALLFVHA